MADAKITSLAALAADPANNDMFVIVDVSDTSMASTGTDKKLAASYLMKASAGATFLLADGSRAGATTSRQALNLGISIANQTGLIQIGNYGTISETGSGWAYITGNAVKASLTTNNKVVKIAADAGQFMRMRYDSGISFHTNLTGAIGTEYTDLDNIRVAIDLSGYVGIGLGVASNTALLDLGASSTDRASLRVRTGTVPTSPNDGDIARGSTGFTLYNIDSGTNAVINHVIANRRSSGTPAAGFGVGFAALLESSTTVDQNAGRLTFAWSTATHASRAAVGKLTAYYTSTEREAITWTADSTSVTVAIPNGPLTTGEIRATGAAGVKLTDSSGVLGVYVAPSGAVSVGNTTGITGFNVLDGTTSKGLLITPLFGGSAYLFAYDIPGTTHIPFVLRANTFDLQTGTSSTTSRLTISASGEIRGNYDTNSTAYFGRCAIGYNGSTSDVASFGHIDMNTSANIALFQTAAGESWFNCASGQNLIFARGGFSLGQWDTSGNLHPAVDNTVDCGKSGSRWNDIWASNATIQTSDERDKVAVKTSALGLDFVKALQPVSWVWADIDRPAVTEKRQNEDGTEYDHVLVQAVKKTHKRPHFGFVAQQVKQALDAVGVDDFAGYIYDEATDSYSLRYSEFLSPIVKALQELLQRVERLEKAN